jgi:hypothetical protein
MGVTAFLTEVLMAATARGRTIRPPFGAALLHHGVGVGNPLQATHAPKPSLAEDPERLTLRQADQAREDFAVILDELAFLREPLARLPDPRRGLGGSC